MASIVKAEPSCCELAESSPSLYRTRASTALSLDPGIDRDELVRELERRGVEVVLRYFPLHLLPEWRWRGARFGDAPVTEHLWFTQLVNLPVSPQLTDDQAQLMVEAVGQAMSTVRAGRPRTLAGAGREGSHG